MMARMILTIGSVVAVSGPAAAFDFAGKSPETIRAEVGRAYAAEASRVAPMAKTREGAIEATTALLATRGDAFQELGEHIRLTSIEGILLADALDDSLIAHAAVIFDTYREANPEPVINAGTEKFDNAVANLGFVRVHATGFLVHLEMQQSRLILADFRQRRSELEVEGAEDAFLRHYGMFCDLYAAQHTELEDLHQCNLANLEWTIGRIETEAGVGDFFLANQFLSYKDEELGYLLKLQSHETGEVIDVRYPLPWMTRLDPGWQHMQKQKAENAENAETRGD